MVAPLVMTAAKSGVISAAMDFVIKASTVLIIQGNTGVRAMKQVQWNALSYADFDKTLAFNAAEKAVQSAINELMKDFNRVVSDVSAKMEV